MKKLGIRGYKTLFQPAQIRLTMEVFVISLTVSEALNIAHCRD